MTIEHEALERLNRKGLLQPDGASLLEDVRAAFNKYVVFPSAEAADIVTLFVAATHAQPAWEHATRLVIKSPLRRCGKTRLQEVAAELCHRPLRTSNSSVAALVRSIDENDPPTLILDEGDTIFSKRRGERSESAEDLRGLLNSGHSRGWPYLRWDTKARKIEECQTFAMAIIGLIGDAPDTIEDRAAIIAMRRRAAGEQVTQFRRRRAIPPLRELRERLHGWIRQYLDELRDAEPDLPVEDRPADVFESLVAVADLAGGEWPQRARNACKALTADKDHDDASAGERLLSDLRALFEGHERLTTAVILEKLHKIDEAPWAEWYGKPLNSRRLAELLRPYGIASKNVRVESAQAKGYERVDLTDAWRRYLGTPPSQASQRPEDDESPGDSRDGSRTGADSAIRPAPDLGKDHAGMDGTAGTEDRLARATKDDPAVKLVQRALGGRVIEFRVPKDEDS